MISPAELLAQARALLTRTDPTGLCREALEAACQTSIRRRRIGRGEPRADVEALLSPFRWCNEGAHGDAPPGPLIDYIRDADKLARWLESQK